MFGFLKKWWKAGREAEPRNSVEEPAAAPLEPITGETAILTAVMAHYEIVAGILTDVGLIREHNEDSVCFIRPGDTTELESKGVLTLVADGMGGAAAGEVASRLTVDLVGRLYYESAESAGEALRNAIRRANREVFAFAESDCEYRGMGTTLVAMAIVRGAAYAAYVGDSRLYLVREGQIYRMTEDHSYVNEMVRLGVLSRDEAVHHEDRNLIVRALGNRPEVEVSEWAHPILVREGDAFVLCTDGLHDLVNDGAILDAVVTEQPDSACHRLVEAAKARGGHDNISVAVVRVMANGRDRAVGARETREAQIVL